MIQISKNDVLLKHNTHILAYALDTIGNKRFKTFINIYRETFQAAEKNKDDETCQKIVHDIIDAICVRSVPKGRFIEYDEKENVWKNVGTSAIPCQRARCGLLDLIEPESYLESEKRDKPIVDMNRTEKARVMKSLHFNEKKVRSKINLKDHRFKVHDSIMKRSEAIANVEEFDSFLRMSTKRKIESSLNGENSTTSNSGIVYKKKNKAIIRQNELCGIDVEFGGPGTGAQLTNRLGNKFFHFLINMRRNSFQKSNDVGKLKEICNVIHLMKKTYPDCRFIQRRKSAPVWSELSWQLVMEKTFQSFREINNVDYLSAEESMKFLLMLQEQDDPSANLIADIIGEPYSVNSPRKKRKYSHVQHAVDPLFFLD